MTKTTLGKEKKTKSNPKKSENIITSSVESNHKDNNTEMRIIEDELKLYTPVVVELLKWSLTLAKVQIQRHSKWLYVLLVGLIDSRSKAVHNILKDVFLLGIGQLIIYNND